MESADNEVLSLIAPIHAVSETVSADAVIWLLLLFSDNLVSGFVRSFLQLNKPNVSNASK
jgi:hypothetical protein